MHKTATTWFQHQFFPSLDGVEVLHTRHIDKVPIPGPDAPMLIVSHAGLSGKLSMKKSPGTNSQWLARNLTLIQDAAPNSAILIGFRQHRSWLEAAYCNKAKKTWGMSRPAYLETFSPEDLSWCKALRTIEGSFKSVFPFLYEELVRTPHSLIADLCGFLGKAPPADLDQVLKVRRNPSPRSSAGQFLSRSLYAVSAASRRNLLKQRCGRFGAALDRFFHVPPFDLPADLDQKLTQDWNDLVRLVAERRGRDLSPLSLHATERN